MGALTSAILMETFMQYLEHPIIVDNLRKYRTIDYYTYMDDTLIIYNTQTKNINNTLDEFNMIHPKIKFMMEEVQDNKINYLDITTVKAQNKLQLGIYRKPTTTEHIIHNDSCHPYEHKKSAINYFSKRMNKCPLTPTKTKKKQV
jgi:hypothetical protein